MGLGPYKEWVGLPASIRVRPLQADGGSSGAPTPSARLAGPVVDHEHKYEHIPDVFCGRATSTYPKGVRAHRIPNHTPPTGTADRASLALMMGSSSSTSSFTYA